MLFNEIFIIILLDLIVGGIIFFLSWLFIQVMNKTLETDSTALGILGCFAMITIAVIDVIFISILILMISIEFANLIKTF